MATHIVTYTNKPLICKTPVIAPKMVHLRIAHFNCDSHTVSTSPNKTMMYRKKIQASPQMAAPNHDQQCASKHHQHPQFNLCLLLQHAYFIPLYPHALKSEATEQIQVWKHNCQ